MPKRTNEFQQLVHTIHRLLEPSARVTESMYLKDQATGDQREVDVVVESETDGHNWLTSIECRDRGRVADVSWVEAMLGKHRDLPTDDLILVSHNGFTPQALRKAAHYHIRALGLMDAVNADWTQIVGKLSHVYMPFLAANPLQCEIVYARQYPVSDLPTIPLENTLFDGDDRPLGTLDQIGWAIARDSSVGKDIMMRKEGIAGDYPATLTYTVPTGSYVSDAQGARHIVEQLRYRILFRISQRYPVPLKHGSLGELPVAFGPLTAHGANISLTIIEPRGQPMSVDLRGDLAPLDPQNWEKDA